VGRNASTGAFASEVQRRTEKVEGGINGEERRGRRRYIRHPVDFTSPFRTGVVAATERREFATPVFLFGYIET